jgi:hypothetical protein
MHMHMYACIYIYIYIYICMYIYTHVCMYVYAHVAFHDFLIVTINSKISIFVVYSCKYVCKWIRINVPRLDAGMGVSMHICTCVHKSSCSKSLSLAPPCSQAHSDVCMRVFQGESMVCMHGKKHAIVSVMLKFSIRDTKTLWRGGCSFACACSRRPDQ